MHGLKTGLPAIDAEHGLLLDKLSDITQRFSREPDLSRFARELGDLVQSAEEHFAHEEAFMARIGYDRLAQHRAQHRRLLETADVFLDSVQSRFDAFDAWAVARYFMLWLVDHIRIHDSRIGTFVRTGGTAVIDVMKRDTAGAADVAPF